MHSFNVRHKWAAAAILLVAASTPSFAAVMDFNATRAASGVSWDPSYSNPVNENGTIGFGALGYSSGPTRRMVSLLGFDIQSFSGQYSAINSITLTGTVSSQWPIGTQGTVNLFRVGDANAGWATPATWIQNGNGSAWAGGGTMADAATGSVLASATVTRGDAVGTQYSWTFSGSAAEQLVTDWISGTNAGLALVDTGASLGVDYRSNIGGIGSAAGPVLSIDYSPSAVPEPTVGMMMISGLGLFAAARRRRHGA